jgi:hypothetical protein
MNKCFFYQLFLISAGIIFVLAVFTACPPSPNPHYAIEKCADWAEIEIPALELIVQNNVWNKQDITNYEQCVFKELTNKDCPFGWHWAWSSTDGSVKSYPELIFGQKPWSPSSTSPSLPIMISDVSNITATYDITQSVSGSYNLAFDIWICSSNPPVGTGNENETIEQEIMIWLNNLSLMPAGPVIDSPEIDGEEYDFHKMEFTDWTYIAFRKKTRELSGDTKIHLFFDYLVANGHISANHYCSSIELGNEVVTGSGTTTFNDFSLQVISK